MKRILFGALATCFVSATSFAGWQSRSHTELGSVIAVFDRFEGEHGILCSQLPNVDNLSVMSEFVQNLKTYVCVASMSSFRSGTLQTLIGENATMGSNFRDIITFLRRLLEVCKNLKISANRMITNLNAAEREFAPQLRKNNSLMVASVALVKKLPAIEQDLVALEAGQLEFLDEIMTRYKRQLQKTTTKKIDQTIHNSGFEVWTPISEYVHSPIDYAPTEAAPTNDWTFDGSRPDNGLLRQRWEARTLIMQALQAEFARKEAAKVDAERAEEAYQRELTERNFNQLREHRVSEEGWTVNDAPVLVTSPVPLPIPRSFKWHKNWADYTTSEEEGPPVQPAIAKKKATPAASSQPTVPRVNAWANRISILPPTKW